MNLVLILSLYLWKIHFNIVFPFEPRSPKSLLDSIALIVVRREDSINHAVPHCMRLLAFSCFPRFSSAPVLRHLPICFLSIRWDTKFSEHRGRMVTNPAFYSGVSGSNLDPDTAILTAAFRRFPQSLQKYSRMVPEISPRPFPSTPITINCPLIILSFDAT